MKNFLYKEFKLCLAPVNYIFIIFSTMILIPSYPSYVPFFYFTLSIFFIFNNSELNKDIAYSMILPISKKHIVKSRCILVCAYEILGIIFTIPFSILHSFIEKNPAGIDANPAFYGLVMIPITVFNLIFISGYYKKAEKPGLPFLFASISYWLLYALLEFPFWAFGNSALVSLLDSTSPADFIKQLPVLCGGIVIFILGWLLTYKISAKRFEKVDL
ncbi:MAG: ABC-2 transporter permease [Treponema sp.]|nr:ABC-2 transporter permease [Treponema sp.]